MEDATACLEALRDGRLMPTDLLATYRDKIRTCQLVVATTSVDMPGPPADGPLHGLPVSLKDNLVCAGTHTGSGTLDRSSLAPEHGELVQRLVAAGAVPFVKSNVPQLLMLLPHC